MNNEISVIIYLGRSTSDILNYETKMTLNEIVADAFYQIVWFDIGKAL